MAEEKRKKKKKKEKMMDDSLSPCVVERLLPATEIDLVQGVDRAGGER